MSGLVEGVMSATVDRSRKNIAINIQILHIICNNCRNVVCNCVYIMIDKHNITLIYNI